MALLRSAAEHYRTQQRITAAAVVAGRRQRGRRSGLVEVVTQFQYLAALDAAAAVGTMLEEQGKSPDAEGEVVPAAYAGVASDGRALDTLVDHGISQQLAPQWFDMMVATQVQDAARAAFGTGIAARPQVSGYIRMMNPPSCSRCAVLAGRFYRWNSGFQRHPRCDCRHIPAAEADYADVRLSGDKWFHTLSPAEQDKAFTKAGAQAIRDGADLNQVVNARRGMTMAGASSTRVNAQGLVVNATRRSAATESVFGHDVNVTREGVTRRGVAYQSLKRRGEADTRAAGERYFRTSRTRLMPESIYGIAGNDRAEAIRLLRLNGYIT